MTKQLATVTQNIVPKEGGNVAVTALLPEEMTGCQSALIAWADRKIAELQSDANELKGAEEHARIHKWKTATLHRHFLLVEKRLVFYGKIKLALQAGYVIVPNFPVQLFAIRTNRASPLLMRSESHWRPDCKQSAQPLEACDGQYQNPFPIVESNHIRDWAKDDPKATKVEHYASGWDEMEFPVSMSKPQIMEATSRAMAMQVFDQLGILPAARKEDPIIVGQLIDPRDKWNNKVVTFMIAWHLDTRVL